MRGSDATVAAVEGNRSTGDHGDRRTATWRRSATIPGNAERAASSWRSPDLKADGHEFIADALARGARFIIHESDFHPPAGITAIRVRDSRRCLGILGRNFFGDPSAGTLPHRRRGNQRQDHGHLSARIDPPGRGMSRRRPGNGQLPLRRKDPSPHRTPPRNPSRCRGSSGK